YDGVQLCERVYFDLLGRLELRVGLRGDVVDGGGNAKDREWRPYIGRAMDLLGGPDRGEDLRAGMWGLVRGILGISAVGIYRRRDRAGRLYSLELVAGDTLKPLIEEHGRTPMPPDPAYQQFVYGLPGALFTTEDLDYLKETPRTESVYGVSRVERTIL